MSPSPLYSRTKRSICAVAVAVATALGASACEQGNRNLAALTGGNAHRGETAIQSYGCGACHVIPGVRGANGLVGPPLTGIAQRAYIAGVLTNTPENLVRWIQNPPAVDSKTAMPNVGVTYQDAVDIAGYLYSLK